jgi:hypothetical protein
MSNTKKHIWLEYCPICKRKHYVTMKPCPECNGKGGWIPMPVSENVLDECGQTYRCDGCAAYQEHLY